MQASETDWMESYRASCGLIQDDAAIYFPLDMPPVVEDIMFTVKVFVLGGAVLGGKTPMSEESFNNPTPTDW